jgi:hypothetical protein
VSVKQELATRDEEEEEEEKKKTKGVDRSLQKFGFSLWNLLHVALLVPMIWTWLLVSVKSV